MILSAPVHAQLKVYSSGNMTLNREDSMPKTKFAIGPGTVGFVSDVGLFTGHQPVIGHRNIGICGKSVMTGTTSEVGVGSCTGVMGIAGGASEGDNFGVFGTIVGEREGAAVIGTINSLIPMISGSYAGYFDGPLCTTGDVEFQSDLLVYDDLEVWGNISGDLLGYASSMRSSEQESQPNGVASSSVATQFAGMQAVPYFSTPSAKISKAVSAQGGLQESAGKKKESRVRYALSAEELSMIYPDLVYDNEDGTKSINYVGLIPLLVQSIGELSAKLTALEGGGQTVKMAKPAATGIDASSAAVTASLGQNDPNPFADVSRIEVNIPSEVKSALLCFYDMSGKQVQQSTLNERGKFTVPVQGSDFVPGMYLYSLITDGKVVETRRMVLTK